MPTVIAIKQEASTAKPHKCEHLAVSPKGHRHCVHDDHIDWRIRGGCNSAMCPLTKNVLEKFV